MRIYFAASIAGGRTYLPVYEKMVLYLKEQGHIVLTEHIVAVDVLQHEQQFTANQVYRRDVEWLESSDVLIAEVSNPSLGVGYEICYALDYKKPVLCLYDSKVFISRMIYGNDRPGLQVKAYKSESEWRQMIESFLGCAK